MGTVNADAGLLGYVLRVQSANKVSFVLVAFVWNLYYLGCSRCEPCGRGCSSLVHPVVQREQT